MKIKDLNQLHRHAQRYDAIAKFEVMDVASISVRANVLVPDERFAGQGRESTIQLAVWPGSPEFEYLMPLLKARADSLKTEAADAITAAGLTPTVDQAELDDIASETAKVRVKIAKQKQKAALAAKSNG